MIGVEPAAHRDHEPDRRPDVRRAGRPGSGGPGTRGRGATDVGIPLGPDGVAALVPANVAAFGEGLERPEDEVRLYLALREAAHQRLFTHVPWLRQRLLATVDALCPRHQRRPVRDRAGDGRGRSDQSAERAGRAVRRPVRAGGHARAAGGAAAARDDPRARRGMGRRRRCRCRQRPDARRRRRCARRPGAGARRAGRPSRPSRRWSGSNCVRAACARRPRCGGASPRSTASAAGTGCGAIRTSCPAPTISTTRSGSPTRWARTPLSAEGLELPPDDEPGENERSGN